MGGKKASDPPGGAATGPGEVVGGQAACEAAGGVGESRLRAAGDAHVPGILQARTLEWVAISFSNA